MMRERLLGGIDVKAGAKSEIIGAGGITRYSHAAWAGIRRDKDQTQFGARFAKLALLGHVGVGAGQARQIPDHRQLHASLMLRDIDRKGHGRLRFAAGVPVNTLHAAMRPV